MMIEVDIKTYRGHIFTCSKCSKIHFEFNQVGIDFSGLNALVKFGEYLNNIDADHIIQQNQQNKFTKKIHIPISGTSFKFLLDEMDLTELKILVKTFIEEYKAELKQAEFISKLTHITKDQRN